MPIKLGQAKLEEYTFTLIHFYDLNPIINEVNKLQIKTKNLTDNVNTHAEYKTETSNYIKILLLIQDRVETKLKELIPHPQRTRRGLINAVGSIFKTITGNLDASDGERYERLIKNLQNNQIELKSNTLKENAISINLIKQFNNTIQQVRRNENLLESKLNQIGLIVQKGTFRENAYIIKDTLNQIINLYEIIDSILQDVENAVTFSKLKILHPSIIKTENLYFELQRIQKIVNEKSMPLEVTLANTLLYEKLVKIESFVLNNKITFLIRFPITHQNNFDYYHLYSIPIYKQNKFKTIVPKSKFLIKNKLHFSYLPTECQEIQNQYYICDKMDLTEISAENPCAIQLLESSIQVQSCQQIEVKISKPIINQLDLSNKWIVIIPNEETVKLECSNQEEHLKLFGTYFAEIPTNCKLVNPSNQEVIINNVHIGQIKNQPILFPDLNDQEEMLPTLNLSVHLDDLKLDDLQKIKNQIRNNQPNFTPFPEFVETPNIWTILIYILMVILVSYYVYKKLIGPRRGPRRGQRSAQEASPEDPIQEPRIIQLPLQHV